MNALCMRAMSAWLAVRLIMWAISAMLTIVTARDASAESVDISRWSTHRVMLSDREFTFRIPGGDVPSEMPVGPPVERLNLERDIAAGEGGVAVFSRVWRYRRSFLWRKTLGYLIMAVSVRPTGIDLTCQSPTVLADLERSIRQRLEETYRGQERGSIFEVKLPGEYWTVSLNQQKWLKYKLGGFKDSTMYATPVSATRYLSVTFDIISNTSAREAEWRQEAHSVVDEIAASLSIEGKGCR